MFSPSQVILNLLIIVVFLFFSFHETRWPIWFTPNHHFSSISVWMGWQCVKFSRNNERGTNYQCVCLHFRRVLLKINSANNWTVSCKIHSLDLYIRIMAGLATLDTCDTKKGHTLKKLCPFSDNLSEFALKMVDWVKNKKLKVQLWKLIVFNCFLKYIYLHF